MRSDRQTDGYRLPGRDPLAPPYNPGTRGKDRSDRSPDRGGFEGAGGQNRGKDRDEAGSKSRGGNQGDMNRR